MLFVVAIALLVTASYAAWVSIRVDVLEQRVSSLEGSQPPARGSIIVRPTSKVK